MSEETVTITKKRLAELESAARMLELLEYAGVDNWAGYEWAVQEHKMEPDPCS